MLKFEFWPQNQLARRPRQVTDRTLPIVRMELWRIAYNDVPFLDTNIVSNGIRRKAGRVRLTKQMQSIRPLLPPRGTRNFRNGFWCISQKLEPQWPKARLHNKEEDYDTLTKRVNAKMLG